MTTKEIDSIIDEVEHSLAVEHLYMTDEEKDNLRRVGAGELTFDQLIASYVSQGQALATAHV